MQSLYPNKIKHLFSVLNCTVSKFLKLRRKKKKVKELSNEERWSCVLGAESMLDITGLSTEDRVWTGRCLGIWSGLSGRCWQKGSGVANSRRRERKEERKGGREDQRASFHPGLLVDYLVGYPLDPCFKREDIGVRTKGLYEYAIYMRDFRDFWDTLWDADLHLPMKNFREIVRQFPKRDSTYLVF